MKIFVGFAFIHHKGRHAGYHQIRNHVDYDIVIDCQNFFESISKTPTNMFCRMKRKIFKILFGFPVFPTFMIRLFMLGLLHKDLVIHYIYGENLYKPILRRLIRRENKIVCTFHQPLEYFLQYPKWIKALKSLDQIILVSNSEIDYFRAITGRDNVTYIPHGIDTEFYRPNMQIEKRPLILTVGNWLRDYKFAGFVYSNILDKHPGWEIVVVALPSATVDVRRHPQIKCLANISDEELRMLYWKSSVLFLPLTRYTANNALLEAAACGCNVVISSNCNDNSYIPQQYITQVEMTEDNAVFAIDNNLKAEYNMCLSDYIDQHYSWKVIGKETEILLNGL